MDEIWKEIDGFDGRYSVSDQGRIRQNEITYTSLQNKIIHHEEKILEPGTWQSRYLRIDLINKKKGKHYRLNTYVHKLVAEYFIGPKPEGYEIDHIDGNYLNNSASNLRYVTRKENMMNPITRKRNSEAHKVIWSNPELRQKQSETMKIIMNKPEVNTKLHKPHKRRTQQKLE